MLDMENDKIEMILDEGDPGFFSTIEEAVAYYIEKYGEDIQVLWVDEDTRLCYVQTDNEEAKVLGYFVVPKDALVEGTDPTGKNVWPIFSSHLVDAKKIGYKFYHNAEEGKTDAMNKYGKHFLLFGYDAQYNCYGVYKEEEALDRFYVYKIRHPALNDWKGRNRVNWYQDVDSWYHTNG